MKVFVLDHGFGGADANWFEAGINYATAFNRNPERMWKINCFYSILIQHPTEGNILFDTGLPSRERFPEWALATMEFEWDEKYSLAYQLGFVGLTPDDIDHVILSHMHMDHAGGLAQCKNAVVYVNRKEAETAFTTVMSTTNPAAHGFYFKDVVLTPVKQMIYLEEDMELFPGIEVINLPGHTPGTMGIILHLDKQTIIETGDSCSLESNYMGMPSNLLVDSEKAAKSIAKIHRLAKKYPDAQVWFSHDLARFKEMKHAPEYYGAAE